MSYMDQRSTKALHITVLSVVAGAIRIGPWLAGHRITFDEGVFLASTDLAKAGLTPFQDFFSSQGPLFIPLLRVGQIVSLGDPRGPRTTLLLAGVGIAIATYFILIMVTSLPRAFLLSSLVALSGSVLLAAGPVQSDGLALAFALTALAISMRPRIGTTKTVLVGVLIGAAIAVKSLHVLPIVATIGVLFLSRLDWKRLALAAVTGAGLVIGVASIFGLSEVWDQYVLFHLAKDNSPNIGSNFFNAGRILFDLDLPLIALAITSVGAPFLFRGARTSAESDMPGWLIPLWLVATVVFLFGFTSIDSGFARTLSFLVPPLVATLALTSAVPVRVLLGIAVVGGILQFAFIDIVPQLDPSEQATIVAIGGIPEDKWFVSDDPGLGWSAGRRSHPDTVDPSFARFQTGYLTIGDVNRAIEDPATCIVASTSGRFDLAGLVVPDDYEETNGAADLWLRPGC